MSDLELLAIGLFNRFAKRNGVAADWNYLSRDRKIEWMKEVVLHTDFLVKQFKGRIKPAPKPARGESSFGVGHFQGQAAAKFEMEQLLDCLDTDLKSQLEDYINKE